MECGLYATVCVGETSDIVGETSVGATSVLLCVCSLPDAVIIIKFYVIDFLPMINFLTDPLIYGVRMREIRRAYRRLVVAVLPCCRCAAAPAGARQSDPLRQSSAAMTELGPASRLSVVAMTTTRTDSRSARRAERSLLDTEFTLHDP